MTFELDVSGIEGILTRFTAIVSEYGDEIENAVDRAVEKSAKDLRRDILIQGQRKDVPSEVLDTIQVEKLKTARWKVFSTERSDEDNLTFIYEFGADHGEGITGPLMVFEPDDPSNYPDEIISDDGLVFTRHVSGKTGGPDEGKRFFRDAVQHFDQNSEFSKHLRNEMRRLERGL